MLTVVVTVAALLPVLGSTSLPLTLAVLVSVPAACGVTLMVIVAVAPLASVPRLQVTLLVQLPWVVVTDPNVTPLGSVSFTVTPVAGEARLLLTVERIGQLGFDLHRIRRIRHRDGYISGRTHRGGFGVTIISRIRIRLIPLDAGRVGEIPRRSGGDLDGHRDRRATVQIPNGYR